MYGLTKISETGSEPKGICLATAKTHLRVTHDDDDSYIAEVLIPAARAKAELETHRQLVPAVFQLALSRFPCRGEPLLLPVPPLGSVDEITISYLDTEGESQDWDSDEYVVRNTVEPAEIWPAYNHVWPTTYSQKNAVTVQFPAGYGTIPPGLVVGMLFVIGHLYRNRESVMVGPSLQAIEIPQAAKEIFQQYNVGDAYADYDAAVA